MDTQRVRWPTVLGIVVGIVVVDQLSKSWTGHVGNPTFGQVRNTGLLMGVLAAPAPVLILWMLFVMCVFIAVIGRWAVQLGISPVAPALICGGFIAHMTDRARFGAVRDFLQLGKYVIDIADIAVVIGIVALVIAAVTRVSELRAARSHIAFDARTFSAAVVRDRAS